jgi:uncharacterized protein
MQPRHYLKDEWSSEEIPLDGPAERQDFHPAMMAVLGLIVAFVLFQIVFSPLAMVVLFMIQGVNPAEIPNIFAESLEEHAQIILSANTIGQILGLAIPAYLLARLSSRRMNAFMRIRRSDFATSGLALVGLIALLPAIQFLGAVNELLPLPDFLRGLEQTQIEMIETILQINTGLLFNLAVLAVTPAICEEILFRGYIQRQSERAWGIVAGILFSGIIFGLYHLRLSQALPLSVLGIYLAYITWRTGSLWPAIIVHFANNAIAVIVADFVRRREDIDYASVSAMQIPWLAVVVGTLLFAGIVAVLHRRAELQMRRNQSSPDESSQAESTGDPPPYQRTIDD